MFSVKEGVLARLAADAIAVALKAPGVVQAGGVAVEGEEKVSLPAIGLRHYILEARRLPAEVVALQKPHLAPRHFQKPCGPAPHIKGQITLPKAQSLIYRPRIPHAHRIRHRRPHQRADRLTQKQTTKKPRRKNLRG